MPAKWFKCPDSKTIEISKCVQPGGCRMKERCATIPFLTLIGYDRKWEGVSPSSAGTGPRQLYLKATTNYIVEPKSRVYALLGTSMHEMLAKGGFVKDVMSEEKLSDEEMKGTADCLEVDENTIPQEQIQGRSGFLLTDYKSSGSFKVAKWLGIKTEKVEENILDEEDKPVLLKSGPNKGNPRTKQRTIITHDPVLAKYEIRDVELQLNRYRIFFEQKGFNVTRMQVMAIPRDGGTWVATNRGIDKNFYLIPIKRLPNKEVLAFYQKLSNEVNEAFKTGYARLCNTWETWSGRRCTDWCEIADACLKMSKAHGERQGIL